KSDVLEEYNDVFRRYIEDQIIEPVPSNESNNLQYIMPHRHVIRDDSTTTRLRVVFDASSHAAGVGSLNDYLYSGPNLNPALTSVLINFRAKPIALTADIAKAFLQISVASEHRKFLRFYWYEQAPVKSEPLPNRIMYQF